MADTRGSGEHFPCEGLDDMRTTQKWTVLVIALLLMASTAVVLARLKTHQKLGLPGVKTAPLPESQNLEVLLPETVPGYKSEKMEQQQIVVEVLPKDTSYGTRRYVAPDGFWTQVNVVLMGSDRTSIHKPQFCLTGAGWKIDDADSKQETVKVYDPYPYDLPVEKIVSTRDIDNNGQRVTLRGIYVYWFVCDDAYTCDHWQRMWWMARDLLKTGVLQRWAYVSYFAICLPGQEDQTYDRIRRLISTSVPDFQLLPKPEQRAASVK
jgi:hypothetical protein